jgi:hypothetical protein
MSARKRKTRRSNSRRFNTGRSWGFLRLGSEPAPTPWLPTFETLESRTMLTGAATLTFSGGVLTMSEPAGTVDSLTIDKSQENFATYDFTNTAGFASVTGSGLTQASNDEVLVYEPDSFTGLHVTLGSHAGDAINFSGPNLLVVSGNIALLGADTVSEDSSFELSTPGMYVDTTGVAGGASHGTINLPGENLIGTFAAETNGGSVNVYGARTIGSVPDGFPAGINTTNNGANPAGADVVLADTYQYGLAINAGIDAGEGDVELSTYAGTISETNTTITAAALAAVNEYGTVQLLQGIALIGPNNSAGVFAATAGGAVTLADTGTGVTGLQIGSIPLTGVVATQAASFGVASPLQGSVSTHSTAGIIGYGMNLATSGSLTIAAPINAGFDEAQLAASGLITESTGDGITASSLVVDDTTTQGGNFILLNQVNVIVQSGGAAGLLAAANSSPGGSITIYNMGGMLQVNSLAGVSVGVGTLAGISTTNPASGPFTNSINLWSIGGLLLNDQINAGFGQVTLHSAVSINEVAGTGEITAGALAVLLDGASTAGSNAQLNQPNRLVQSDGSAGLLAVSNLSPGGSVTVDNTGGGTQIDSLDTATVAGPTIAGIITTNAASAPYINQVNLVASGAILLNDKIDAGLAAAEMRAGGSIIETGTNSDTNGVWAASLLAVAGSSNEGGSIILLNQVNVIAQSGGAAGLLAAANSSPGGSITIYNMGGVLQADSLSGAALGLGTVAGFSATNPTSGPYSNSISLWGIGGILLNNQVSAGFGQVTLHSPVSITEAAGTGEITAGALAVLVDRASTTGSNVQLNQPNQLVQSDGSAGLLAVSNFSPGGSVTVDNTGGAMQIDSLDTATVAGPTIAGITTTNTASAPYTNQVNLLASGAIVLNDKINAGLAAVELRAGTSITETGTNGNTNGVWAASLVAVAGSSNEGGGMILLNQVNRLAQADGAPGLLAAEDYSPGAPITIYSMAGTLQVDSLSAAAVALGTITGITTTNNTSGTSFSNNIDLLGNTSIILNAGLSAGFAEVELRALGGSITENANGTIAAGALGVEIDSSPAGSNVELAAANDIEGVPAAGGGVGHSSGNTPGLIAILDNSPGGSIVLVNANNKPLHETTLSMSAVALTTTTGVSANGGSVSVTPTPT